MKRLIGISIFLTGVLALGCSSMSRTSYVSDDLYGSHDQKALAVQRQAEVQAALEQQKRYEELTESRKAEIKAMALENSFYNRETPVSYGVPAQESYTSVLADDYDTAYQRRLEGIASPTYRMPSSYFNLQTSTAYDYASAYDPAQYNVMLSGDQVWVEPKYITSMFGTWGAQVVNPAGNWYIGWHTPVYHFLWGYPHYTWYDWYWRYDWDPFWGWGWPYRPYHYGWHSYHHWGPHYWHHPGYHPGHHPGGYRPVHHTPGRYAPSQRGGGHNQYWNGGRGSSTPGGRGGGSGYYSSQPSKGNGNSGRGGGQHSATRNNTSQNKSSYNHQPQHSYSAPSHRGGGNSGGSHSGGGGFSGGSHSGGGSHGGGGRGGGR